MPRPEQTSLRVETVFSGLVIPLSTSVYSNGISLLGLEGYLSLYFANSGDGTATLLYELSNDGTNWSQVTTLSSLATGFVKTSGPASDGKTFLFFNPPVAAWLRLKVTETGGASTLVVTAVLGML
jgi:hypothetical protein